MHKWLYTKNFSQKTLLAITLLCLSRLNICLNKHLQIPSNSDRFSQTFQERR